MQIYTSHTYLYSRTRTHKHMYNKGYKHTVCKCVCVYVCVCVDVLVSVGKPVFLPMGVSVYAHTHAYALMFASHTCKYLHTLTWSRGVQFIVSGSIGRAPPTSSTRTLVAGEASLQRVILPVSEHRQQNLHCEKDSHTHSRLYLASST